LFIAQSLEEEKLKLNKQRLEISSLNRKSGPKKRDKPEKERQYGVLEVQTAEKKYKKDMPVAMFSNYYNEADKKSIN
jgi:hypothetical protein